jgi:hypothetical protein
MKNTGSKKPINTNNPNILNSSMFKKMQVIQKKI